MQKPLLLLLALAMSLPVGCSRTKYRTAADRDVYGIVREKSTFLSEPVPPSFSIRPDVRSRFYDPTNPDCPQLPTPKPVLYGYEIPPLRTASPQGSSPPPAAARLSVPLDEETAPSMPSEKTLEDKGAVVQASFSDSSPSSPSAQAETTDEAGKATDTQEEQAPNGSNGPSVGSIANRVVIPQQAWSVLPQSCRDRMFEFESLRRIPSILPGFR